MSLFDSLENTFNSTVSDVADSVGGFVSDRIGDATGQNEVQPPPPVKPATTIAGVSVPISADQASAGALMLTVLIGYLCFFRGK